MVVFGYARVSTRDQNLDRQLDQLREVVPDERNIITDMQSGKYFDRKGYNTLVGSDQNAPLLRKGDLLIITSLDRLGRNYTEIHQQWARITKEIGSDIRGSTCQCLIQLQAMAAWIIALLRILSSRF